MSDLLAELFRRIRPVMESNPPPTYPIKIHSLGKVRNSEFWPNYVDPRNPSAPVDRPYCPEAQTDWEELAQWVQHEPGNAQKHMVRISGVTVCSGTNQAAQGYREKKWEGSVLVKKEKNNETGIVYDPQYKLWYITTGLIQDQRDIFVVQARSVLFSVETGELLGSVLETGKYSDQFSLHENYVVDQATGTIRRGAE